MITNEKLRMPIALRRRRGTAVVLAMLFLVLFSALAVGFTIATEMSSQISGNERDLALSRQSAEAGMMFVRYQLGVITLPSGTTNANLLQNTADQLAAATDPQQRVQHGIQYGPGG